MMDDPSTDSLRKLAPSWTLAGDEQLLTVLQKTHQRLLTKCQEANSQLEQMTTALNDASISLQNVNNQFMALSNRQFIESRVYDDDELPPEVPAVKEAPQADASDELSSLKRSLAALQEAHELITILHDSDTESDSEDDLPARLVLKPKDMYASRPLPYIIGSQPWKNKWHAGLVAEDSESEGSASGGADSDVYSEDGAPAHAHATPAHTTVSETSSSLPSEQGSVPRPTAADVANEIARRLGATEPTKPVDKEPDYADVPAKPVTRKVYRPQDPVSSTVFPDEPPPLSDESDHSDSQESDIFADLHRQQPYARAQVSDELFGFNERQDSDDGDIFSDFKQPANIPSGNASSPMFPKRDAQRDHHTAPKVRDDGVKDDDGDKVKKPVGGISLFGNKGTESIGAAILKRNQRKSTSSDAESESDSRSDSQTNQHINQKQKDIFDDLFARSEGKNVTKGKDIVKDIKTEIQKKIEVKEKKVEKVEKPKVDLFSDNLFDDIDDIFSTNVVKMPTKDNVQTKSIFEDDDDLFSEIAAPKPVKVEVASSSNNKKSIFDSDDELFAEDTKPKPVEKPIASPKPVVVEKPNIENKPTEPKISKNIPRSIFDDDDDDEDDIFSDLKTDKHIDTNKVQNNAPVILEKSKDFSVRVEDSAKNIAPPSSSVFKSPSLFDDDDDDESDLFAEPSKSNVQHITVVENTHIENVSIKNEVNIPDDILRDDVILPPAVKSNEISKDKNDNLNIDSKPINSNVNNNISATESIGQSEDSNPPLPVSEPLDRKNVETNAAKISDHIHKNIQNIEQSSTDTNNDFSDQDFDDLPPKEHNKNPIVNPSNETTSNNIPESSVSDDIFDKPLEDDIFVSPEQEIDNKETVFKKEEAEVTETLLKETLKTDNDNKTDQIISKNIEAGIFTDILTEPPEFEKPKEPKRSKNVNALFDDDSDDESLFFKKNEPIFVENPEDFTPTQDRIFGLFTDEPPDDGFSKISDDIDDDMFSTLPKPKIPQNENLPPIPDVNFESNLPDDVGKVLETENDPVDDIFNDITKSEEYPPNESSDKKVDADVEKIPKNLGIKEQSPTIFSDDELFKTPTTITKPISKPTLDIVSDDEDLFSTVTEVEKPTLFPKNKDEIPVPESNPESIKSSDDELFVANNGKLTLPENILRDTKITHDEDIFKIPKTKPEFMPKPDDTSIEVRSEPKKVGKLKVGLNINVNALLPGASPKKTKPNDQTDGQTQSVVEPKPETKVNPEVPKSESQTTDSKMIKSVSFDGEPESDILDNKLSKERAKIQVKRRPSTRRARREAVRKSGIDFGEDSTDNSSSIDDPPRKQPEVSQKSDLGTKDNEIRPTESTDKYEVETKPAQAEIPSNLKETSKAQPENAEIGQPYRRDVKSKVVYILNDEDIFNTSPVNKPDNISKTGFLESGKRSENLDTNTGISTLGKVYDSTTTKNDETTKKDVKSSLFGDENDDDELIFKGKSKTVVKKTSIFDSDSEEELFGNNNKKERNITVQKVEVKKEIKREVVKGSLFGDDDDDDDLFGVKTKTSAADQKSNTSKPAVKDTPKPTEPVFEDPLSMFGGDD